jgi:hypothetical protein
MKHTAEQMLSILDHCCDAYTFPMLDNGYVYLAATRLSLFRSQEDWAMVIEVFGFSPRAGLPDTHIHTFSNRLHHRDTPDQYVSREAYENYLTNNPYNESRFVYPIDEGTWQDQEDLEFVAAGAKDLCLRGDVIDLPSRDAYEQAGVKLEIAERAQIFELCRCLAHERRDDVLATAEERRVSVAPELKPVLTLDEWAHPDLLGEERPSGSVTFQQLARVLETGDLRAYQPVQAPNTHWRNWPEGGSL